MTKGRPVDPTRARRDTGHRPKPGEAKPAVAIASTSTGLMIEPPADLAPEAQAMFRRVVAELGPRGLREADVEAISMMCHSAYIHFEARRKITETGVLVQGPRGPMVNPMIKVARDEANIYLRLANEFGLTLAARLRLGLMQLAGESVLASMNKDLDGPSVKVSIKP